MEKQISEFSQTPRDDLSTEFYNLVFAKTPVSTPVIHKVEVGTSIKEAITQIQKEHLDKVQVAVNSRMENNWDILPEKGDNVVATVVPGEAVTGSILLTQLLISALVVGATAIGYALFKPEEPEIDEANRLPSIRGIGNTARKYEPFRAIFGKRLVSPDYLAEPYTETRGDDEWFKLLLCVGYGPLKLENFKIGDTPLEDYEHNIEWIDHYARTSENDVRSLWPNDIVEERPNVELVGPDSTSQLESTSTLTGYVQSTANAPDKIGVEFLGAAGLKGDDEHRAVSIDHEYVNPVTITVADSTFGTKTVNAGTTIKVLRIVKENVSDSTKFRPIPNGIIKMSDGSYRVCVGKNIDLITFGGTTITRQPWDRTDGKGTSHTRNIRRRSRTFPTSAIIRREGNLLHIDMDRLNGTPRTIGYYDDDTPFSEVSDGTWSSDSALMGYFKYAKSSKQYRGSLRYTPIHKFSTEQAERDYASGVITTTRKVFPQETPDDATTVDNILLTKFKTIRNQTLTQFKSLLGYDKPYLRYDGAPAGGVRNFRPVIIALEVKATEQLSGMIGNFNVEATTVVPGAWESDWRNWPSSIAFKTTENPAECYRWLLQGPMTDAPMSNSRLNLDNLAEWRDYCNQPPPENTYDTKDQWRISYALVENSTLMRELQKIAFTGRAEFSFDDSKYGVVIKDRKQYPVQVFSPKNSWRFSAARVYPEKVDGIRFEFDNELKQYQQDESDFLDPRLSEYQRTGKFNGTTIEGVPSYDMGYRIARMGFYEEFLQRERYKLTTDIEGLVARRGSLVRVQHDVIDVGLGSGRVIEVGSDYIILDETFQLVYEEYFMDNVDVFFSNESITFEGAISATFGIQLRYSDGTIPEEPIQGVYQGNGRFDVAGTDIVGLQVGDFAIYGDLGRETIDCLVIGIEYGEDLTCQISLVNYDDEVFEIDENPGTNPIPDFESNLALRPEFQIPNAPSLATFDEETGIDITKQQLYLSLEYNAQLESPVESFYFQARSISTDQENYHDDLDLEYDVDAGWEFAGVVPYGETQFTYQGIERGTAYRLRARARGRGDLYSAYSTPVNAIVPLDFPPEDVDVSTISFTHTREGVILKWGNITDPDLAYYEVRTDTNAGAEEGLVGEAAGTRLNVGYNDSSVTYYIFARTVYGAYSEVGSSITVGSFYVPPQLTARTQEDGLRGTRLRWEAIINSPGFPAEYLEYYEVRTDTNVGLDLGLVTTLQETSTLVDYVASGSEPTYYVYARSVAGYYSDTLSITLSAPSVNEPTELLATPVDNVAVIDWEAPTNIIYPIDGYDVEERLPGRVEYTKIGNVSATFFNATEREGGTYSFRVRSVDVAGNKSGWVDIGLTLYNPTDFVLFYNQSADFLSGTTSNGHITTDEDGKLRAYFPLDDTKTIQNYIDEAATESGKTSATVTIQDKIDNVGPYMPQYTYTGSSYFERVFDLFDGSTEPDLSVENNTIEINYEWQYIQAGEAVDVSSTIEWSEDGSTWSTPANGTKVFVSDSFRYVRVRVYFDSSANLTGLPFVQLNSLEIEVDVKQKTDQGRANIVGQDDPSFPTEIFFNKEYDADTDTQVNKFVDVVAVTATIKVEDLPPGTGPAGVTVYTEFEYSDGSGGVYRDRFKAYCQDTVTGDFIPATISWQARGV